MHGATQYPITVVELRLVQKELDDVLDRDEVHRLIDFLAVNPLVGDVIPATDGVRKARWRTANKGKRGGLRIIYYFRDLNMPIYIVAVYKKGEKLDLTAGDKVQIRKLVADLVKEHAKCWAGAEAKSAG